ncbi:DNA-binding protein [Mycobacteroides stephanolepidis]|uniref:DNA-binding protein n=1 Tax=[Mycobacterium] stephanolepidis TaxID=1520670 RepID=A0A1Z4ETQ4_9MYCO|nr:ATP-binding protein [[Mycobacterium] stephanolepidis]BAX96313.1 DNA-binding protein [[Mycobacterium] stephanolepidis]
MTLPFGDDVLSLAAQEAILHSIFRPSAPTEDRAMFKGRTAELSGVLSAVQQVGQHVIVYGERGVGKTSLAYMAREAFQQASAHAGVAVRVACGNDDNFASVWKKLTAHLQSFADLAPAGIAANLEAAVDKYEDIIEMSDAVTPDSAARALKIVANAVPLVVILDEFDRIGAWDDTVLFADLVKMLSDDLVKCTVFIVGVADNVAGLLAGHASIDRCLKQVYMPRMSADELREIVVGGFQRFNDLSGISIELETRAVDAIIRLSQGFPYYTHLLAGAIGELALRNHKHETGVRDVFEALVRATEEAAHSIRVSYTDAVASAKPAGFDMTLLACAIAEIDELGFFAPVDISGPLSNLSGRTRRTPSYLGHLKRFADSPIYILDTRGEGRKTRYRFRDPLMKPFVMMKGFKDGALKFPQNTDDA